MLSWTIRMFSRVYLYVLARRRRNRTALELETYKYDTNYPFY